MRESAARLRERLGERGGALAADPAFDALVGELIARAEARLPHAPVARTAVIDRIADALLAGEGAPDRAAASALNAADLYLALALAAKDERALAVAEAELIPAVRQSVGRIDANAGFIDEVTQRVRERLLVGDGEAPPAIAKYRGSGPLTRWVRVIASRIALDLKRADGKIAGESEDALAQLPAPSDPELEIIWRTCAVEYKAALTEAFASLSKRERNLLRQRYLDDLNIDTLGRIYRVNPSTTSRWLKQIEERLASATRTALMTKLAISGSAVPSMERLIASQLQPSLPRLLRGGGGSSSSGGGGGGGGGTKRGR
jgi:RNA polymerase sigma-70 factor (ECF subfamily)